MRAGFSNRFDDLENNVSTDDEIIVNLSASIANAADFVPPQELDFNTLSALGEYTFTDDLFTLTMPDGRITIQQFGSQFYVQKFAKDSDAAYESYSTYDYQRDLVAASGRIVGNSAIGWDIIIPEEGLYKTTVLGASL